MSGRKGESGQFRFHAGLSIFLLVSLAFCILGARALVGDLDVALGLSKRAYWWSVWAVLIGSQAGLVFGFYRPKRVLAPEVQPYAAVFELNEAVLIGDPCSGNILQANRNACAMYGYSYDELLGLNTSDLAAGEEPYAAENDKLWTQKAIEGDAQLFEWRSKRRDGSLFWTEISLKLTAVNGDEQLLMVVRDISKYKQAQATTQEMASHLESIGKHFTAGMIYQLISSPNGGRKFTYLSDSVRQLYGISPEQGLQDASLIYSRTHADDLERLAIAETNAIERLATFTADVRNYDVSGEVRWSSLVSTPKLLHDGCICWDGIELTITEQKRLEEQLRQMQKMEAIGTIAGGVAHDFNNLMCVILGYVDLAIDGASTGESIADDLAEVKRAGTRAAALTRQLLAFSRRQVLQPVRLNLSSLVERLRNVLMRTLGEDVELVCDLESELDSVHVDPSQLEQVLLNLATNARDAMPHGGRFTVSIRNAFVRAESTACSSGIVPGPYVELTVADNGSGMDEATKARIFDPFFTTKGVGKGTGLGLSMVYGVVQQSGGNISVQSELGRGTTFSIFLPLDNSTASEPRPASPVSTEPTKSAVTILLVEDEDSLRRVVKRALCAAGYQVLDAANGDEAILASSQHGGVIHLLVTDVVMPRMNGRVLAERLTLVRPSLRVLFMSGYSDDIIGNEGATKSVAHFLPKPFTMPCLTQKVKDLLRSTPPTGPS